jgi:hypothetical protein
MRREVIEWIWPQRAEQNTKKNYNAKLSQRAIQYSELATIEYQFEFGEAAKPMKVTCLTVLLNVLEVLKEIHEVTDEDLIQANHKRFKEHHERKLQTV